METAYYHNPIDTRPHNFALQVAYFGKSRFYPISATPIAPVYKAGSVIESGTFSS